ncbi:MULTISPECIES: PASTA domain-containing protein [Nocardia]|uniref:PASTA domain-containing protein n=1 Tax=Nocardia TaxID=1817 RepID=UPI000A03273A|nr:MULTISPECIES: PASTA domain-containing protein [Nocardia]
MKRIATYLAIAAIGAATACGATETTTTQPTIADTKTTVPVPTTTPPTQTPQAQAPSSAPAATQAVTVPMPNVVCMNLQAAQDLIQKAGVFFSRSKDATGAGRMQILDRNWVVVAQTPAAGVPIGEGDAVLSVVKKGEPGDCS